MRNGLFTAPIVDCVFQDGQSRTVRQFQFTDWPEQGVPTTGEGFIEFIGQVHKTKEQFGQEGPITVHCRYGTPMCYIWHARDVSCNSCSSDRKQICKIVHINMAVGLKSTRK